MKESILNSLIKNLKENKINIKDIEKIDVNSVDFNRPKFMKFKKAIIKAGLISSIGFTAFAPVSIFNNNFGIVQEVNAKTPTKKIVNVKFKNKKLKKNQVINVSNEKLIKLNIPKNSTVKVTLNKKNKSSLANKIKKNKKVKFSKLGKYKINVSLKNKKSLVFYVKSKDKTKPVITMDGESNITLEQFESFKIPSVVAKDNVDGNITKKVIIDVEKDSLYYTDLSEEIMNGESVKFFNPGTYNIIYSVKDKAGNKTEKTRTINVVSKKTNSETTEKTPQTTENTTESQNNEEGFYYLGELDGKKYYRDDNYFLYYDDSATHTKIAVIIADYRQYDNDWKNAIKKYNDSLKENQNEVMGKYLGEVNGIKYYYDEKYFIFHVAEDGSYIYDLSSDYRLISSDWKEALGIKEETNEVINNNYLGENENIKYYYDENYWIYHIDSEEKKIYDLTSDYRLISSNWKEALGIKEEINEDTNPNYLGESENIKYYYDENYWIYHINLEGKIIYDLTSDYRQISSDWKDAINTNNVVNGYYYLGEDNNKKYYRDENYLIYCEEFSIGADSKGNEVEYSIKVPVVLEDYRKYDNDWKSAIEKYNNLNNNEENVDDPVIETEHYLGEKDGIKYYYDEDYWIYHKNSNDDRVYDVTSDYRQISSDWEETLIVDTTNENVKNFTYLGEYDSVNYYANEKNWICYYTIIDSELTPVYIITNDYKNINSDWEKAIENYYGNIIENSKSIK